MEPTTRDSTFNRKLAVEVGVNEAIILRFFATILNDDTRAGLRRTWVVATRGEIQEHLPWFWIEVISDHMVHLRKRGIVRSRFSKGLGKSKKGRTLEYAVNWDKLKELGFEREDV